MKSEVYQETIHGRRGKCRTEFKGVVNKILVSSLVLAIAVGSLPMTAYAANIKETVNDAYSIHMAQHVNQVDVIHTMKNTLSALEELKSKGLVTNESLRNLAICITSLEQAGKATNEVESLLNRAEKLVEGLKLSEVPTVQTAITVARDSLFGSAHTVSQAKGSSVKAFSDVPTSHWAHDAIMDMVSKGLFSGTTTPVNGIGTFEPDATMTRAQFITVVTRYLFANDLKGAASVDGVWYGANYNVAVDNGLVKESEFSIEAMNKPMTRQEMAMVLVRAMDKLGEDKGILISTSRIPDYNGIGTYYRNYVQIAYSKGFIAGVDNAGTFSPMGTLNRAQAATVLYRLVEPSTRVEIDLTTPTQKEEVKADVIQDDAVSQVFYEGEKHNKPQAGDICIRKDGTRVVVDYDEYGILRAEGCDIYTGTVINGVMVKEGMASYYDQRPFRKDSKTGEMLSMGDWNTLKIKLSPNGKFTGDYDGEVMNTWYEWDTTTGLWLWKGPLK